MALQQFTNLNFEDIKSSIKDYLRENSSFSDMDFEGSNLSIIVNLLAYNSYITASIPGGPPGWDQSYMNCLRIIYIYIYIFHKPMCIIHI